MRATPFLLLTVFCLLVVLGRPDNPSHKARGPLREEVQEPRQEEQTLREQALGEQDENEVRISFEIMRREDEAIADIMWLRKAAKEAVDRGSPYFNVLEQDVSQNGTMTIEGTIRLENDPMMAEYDANEILGLTLSPESL